VSTPPPRILAESNRVEAFSDGVLAIAITLLVLDLHTAGHPGHVGGDLLAQWPTYLAYVASFIYIGVVWVNHHALFNRIASVDTGLLWCNLALLLAASVLPFPTAELAFAMGQGAGAVHAVKPAGEIVRDMMDEAEEVLARMARLVRAAS